MHRNVVRQLTCLALIVFAAAGCSSFAPSAYLNSSAIGVIETDRGFCIEEKSLDPRRINASKTINRMFSQAGFDTSCSAGAYIVEWTFEATDQRVDHAHLPTFCSGYGYWRSCTVHQETSLTTYQRSFHLVVREALDAEEAEKAAKDTDPEDQRRGAVWVASLDSRGSKTDYLPLMAELITPILDSLGQDHENTLLRLVTPANP